MLLNSLELCKNVTENVMCVPVHISLEYNKSEYRENSGEELSLALR